MKMKKNIFLWICCLLAGTAYSQIPYDISGEWKNGAGKQVYLKHFDPASIEESALDSALVAVDGSFILKGEVEKKQFAALAAPDCSFRILYLNGESLAVKINETRKREKAYDAPYELKEAGIDQSAASAMMQFWIDDYIRNFSLGGQSLTYEHAETQEKREAARQEITRLNREKQEAMDVFLSRYKDSEVAPFFVEINLKMLSLEEMSAFYDGLSERVKQTEKGREIGERIRLMKKLAPGSSAPDFELITPEGNELALKDLRGHIVLLDFWASWCGPCMEEMPNLKMLYEKFHDRGLEIVGVSMDHVKDNWTGAIGKAGLVWRHVSSLRGMRKCPVAREYQVVAIPKLYIISEEGRIIANDLRGEELVNKIEELYAPERSSCHPEHREEPCGLDESQSSATEYNLQHD